MRLIPRRKCLNLKLRWLQKQIEKLTGIWPPYPQFLQHRNEHDCRSGLALMRGIIAKTSGQTSKLVEYIAWISNQWECALNYQTTGTDSEAQTIILSTIDTVAITFGNTISTGSPFSCRASHWLSGEDGVGFFARSTGFIFRVFVHFLVCLGFISFHVCMLMFVKV